MQKNYHQIGRSMVEIICVLGIIGLISISSVAGLTYVFNRQKAVSTIKEITRKLVALKTAQDLTLEGTTDKGYGYEVEQNDGKFTIRLSGVPEDICKVLKKLLSDNELLNVQIDNDEPVENEECTAGNNALVFYDGSSEGEEIIDNPSGYESPTTPTAEPGSTGNNDGENNNEPASSADENKSENEPIAVPELPSVPTVLVPEPIEGEGSPECTKNDNCSGETPVCDITTHTCVACTEDTPVWDTANHTCVACLSDSDCGTPADGWHCNNKSCEQCTGNTPVWDTISGLCVECTHNSQCNEPNPACDTTTHTCVTCTENANCSGAMPVCDTQNHICVGCINNTDCSGATPVCDTTNHICVGCISDADCTTPTAKCDTTNHTCVACLSDSDCGTPADGWHCNNKSCEQCTGNTPVWYNTLNICVGCTENENCSDETPVCDTINHTCVGCISDEDCSGETPVCDAAVCVESIPSSPSEFEFDDYLYDPVSGLYFGTVPSRMSGEDVEAEIQRLQAINPNIRQIELNDICSIAEADASATGTVYCTPIAALPTVGASYLLIVHPNATTTAGLRKYVYKSYSTFNNSVGKRIGLTRLERGTKESKTIVIFKIV